MGSPKPVKGRPPSFSPKLLIPHRKFRLPVLQVTYLLRRMMKSASDPLPNSVQEHALPQDRIMAQRFLLQFEAVKQF
jgi:hypothetical protein